MIQSRNTIFIQSPSSYWWLCGRVPDLQLGGCRFESRPGLLRTKVYQPSVPTGSVNEYQLYSVQSKRRYIKCMDLYIYLYPVRKAMQEDFMNIVLHLFPDCSMRELMYHYRERITWWWWWWWWWTNGERIWRRWWRWLYLPLGRGYNYDLTSIQPRFDSSSTPIRLQFHSPTTIRRPTLRP